jgi:plasmid stabilization system protein ParE
MAKRLNVSWTEESKIQVDSIVEYLRDKWTEKEVDEFLDLLLHFEKTISQFPKTFKESWHYKGCRLGFVHRHVTAIYKISRSTIVVLTVFDNRSNKYKR